MRALVLASAMAVAACSQQMPGYVEPVSSETAARMSYDIADLIKSNTKPASGAIAIDKPAGDVMIAPALATDLEADGFQVSDHGRHHLSYVVTTIPDGVVLRLFFDHWSAARLYQSSGAMSAPAGPFSIQGGEG